MHLHNVYIAHFHLVSVQNYAVVWTSLQQRLQVLVVVCGRFLFFSIPFHSLGYRLQHTEFLHSPVGPSVGVSPLYRKLKEYVESLVRNQIKNGHFTGEVWTASFTLHSQVRVFECFV